MSRSPACPHSTGLRLQIRGRGRILIGTLISLWSGSTTVGAASVLPAATATVHTSSGWLVGESRGTVRVFRGIPYVAAPTGSRRWRVGQPIEPWLDVRDAKRFGPDCLQNAVQSTEQRGGRPQSEDCLFLNVWAPADQRASAVLLWIHGGGFVAGSGSDAVFDGTRLAQQRVIVVTLNYRLGRFGFFSHPALTRAHPGEPTGNFALMDQIAALQWIRRNIAAFGGDPANVTIAGESAGGASVLALMGSPMARGLFAKAIVESGGGREALPSLEQSHDREPSGYQAGEAFAAEAGLSSADMTALQALPAQVVLGDLGPNNNQHRTDYSGMVHDGQVVVGSPAEIFAQERQARVPLLIGYNSNEVDDAPPLRPLVSKLTSAFGPDERLLLQAYDPQGGSANLSQHFLSDLFFVEPVRALARYHARAGQPTFVYQFSYVEAAKRGERRGAKHASELPYVFDTLGCVDPAAQAGDKAVATLTSQYWARFAREGRPTGLQGPWHPFDSITEMVMQIGSDQLLISEHTKGRLDQITRAYSRWQGINDRN